MDTADTLLQALNAEADPRARWELLRQAPPQVLEHPAVQAALLWWQARYLFMDKKQTLVRDRFVWLFIMCKSASRKKPRKKDPLNGEYQDALCTPELQAAMLAEDRLYPTLLDSARLYADTLRQPQAFFGFFSPRRDNSPAAVNARVGEELVQTVLEPLAQRCAGQPYLDNVLHALFEGTAAVYPGIQADLLACVGQLAEEAVRARITRAVQHTPRNDTLV